MAKIYVASSWRNTTQPSVVESLRAAGHEVYDFRNPPRSAGFRWSGIDPEWESWTPAQYKQGLLHPVAEAGFKSDFRAMQWADTFVGVMPFGRSASMEMGWAAGQGKKTILLLADGEPELMVKMFDCLCLSLLDVVAFLEESEKE